MLPPREINVAGTTPVAVEATRSVGHTPDVLIALLPGLMVLTLAFITRRWWLRRIALLRLRARLLRACAEHDVSKARAAWLAWSEQIAQDAGAALHQGGGLPRELEDAKRELDAAMFSRTTDPWNSASFARAVRKYCW